MTEVCRRKASATAGAGAATSVGENKGTGLMTFDSYLTEMGFVRIPEMLPTVIPCYTTAGWLALASWRGSKRCPVIPLWSKGNGPSIPLGIMFLRMAQGCRRHQTGR